MKKNNISELLKVMKQLRDPKKGCPWDKKQTMETIIPHSIEEVYEVAEQIYKKDYEKLKEELGDLLFQVVYLSQIASEKKKFNFNDVVKTITSKMINRHPHVFNNKKFKTLREFKLWWEDSKNKKQDSILDNIPITYPALLEANKIIEQFINKSYEEKINKLIVVTGKGLHSENEKNPFVSKKLSILKYSVPEFIKNNKKLMKKIIEFKDAEIKDGGSGAFYIYLKKLK
mgnify:CR=1 FL=1